MPNARQIGLTPNPAVATEVPVENRVASDILNALSGLSQAGTGALQQITNKVEEANKDYQNYLSYMNASDDARKQLEIAKSRERINEIDFQQKQAETIQTYYEKIKAQERTGLLASAVGRTREQLANMLATNPTIIDADNMLDYRNEVAKRLAFQDSGFIFQKIQEDANRLNAPERTVAQHVDDMIATRQFASPEQQRAYLEVLLPAVAQTNESLLKQAYDKHREDTAYTMQNLMKFDVVNNANSGSFNDKTFFDVFNKYRDQAKQLFPEQSDAKIEATVLTTMGDALYGTDSLVDPYVAQKAIDSVLMDNKGKPTTAANSKYAQFLSGAKYSVDQRVTALENKVIGDNQKTIEATQDYNQLNLMASSFAGEYHDGKISQFVYDSLNNMVSKQQGVVTAKEYELLKSQIPELRSDGAFKAFGQNLEYSKARLGQDRYELLRSQLSTQMTKQFPDTQVWQALDPNVKGAENIVFGPKHDPTIDEVYTKLASSGSSQKTIYSTIYTTYGRLTPTMITNLNAQADSGNTASIKNAMSTIAGLPPEAVDKLVNTNETGQQLSPKLRTLVYNQLADGMPADDLIASVASVPNKVFDEGTKALVDGKNGNLIGSKAIAGSALSTGMLFWKSVPSIPKSLNDETRELYSLRYAQIYNQSQGEDPATIAKAAQEATINDIKARYTQVDVGDETLAIRNLSRNGFDAEDARNVNPFVAIAKQAVANDMMVLPNNLRIDQDNIKVDEDNFTIPLRDLSTGSLRPVANIVIPKDKMIDYQRMLYLAPEATPTSGYAPPTMVRLPDNKGRAEIAKQIVQYPNMK